MKKKLKENPKVIICSATKFCPQIPALTTLKLIQQSAMWVDKRGNICFDLSL